MKRAKYYKYMFLISAIWNWAVAVIFILFYRHFFTKYDMYVPEMPLWHHMTWAMILILGIGYFRVSRDIHKNHDIVRLGIMGKIVFFGMATWFLYKGDMHVMVWSGALGDLICAILFIEFLANHHKTLS